MGDRLTGKPTGRPSLGPRVSTAIRFPVALHDRLEEAAQDRDLSVNWLVVRAVEHYLDRLRPVDEMLVTAPAKPATE